MGRLARLLPFAFLTPPLLASPVQDCVFPARPGPAGWQAGAGGSGATPHVHRRTLDHGDAGRAPLADATGTLENLVILLRFSDHGPGGQDRTLPTPADVSTIMNAVGGDPTLAPTGSVRDYYIESSYGLLTIDSTVVGWFDLPLPEPYYADGASGASTVVHEMISAGLDLADAVVDFTDFDSDGDGWIDAITFLHSGYGAEWGGDDVYGTSYLDRIWSHKWAIPTWTSAEGVRVADYHVSPGLWAVSGSAPGRIGVVCHELGHFLGLPDLYDTDGGGNGLGMWGLMGAGSWGFDLEQLTPVHPSGWSKMKLGWVEPEKILPGSHTALQSATSSSLFMIDSGYPSGEYLLIENRQPTGFDATIPEGGLAIWHVDESRGSFTYNDVNREEGYPGLPGWPDNGKHYRVALLQADGLYELEQGDTGDADDLYRAGGVSTIDGTSVPSTDGYQDFKGTPILESENRITAIGPSGPAVSFTYENVEAPFVPPASPPWAYAGAPYSAWLSSVGGMAPLLWTEHLVDPAYVMSDLGPQPFPTGGVPQGFDDAGAETVEDTWDIDLPFAFPYWQSPHTKVYVTPNGCVDLAPLWDETSNRAEWLRALPRIAGLWDDLSLDGAGDLYVTSTTTWVRLRWDAVTAAAAEPVNVAITLHDDGRIRFDYGGGNTGLTPTVGTSRGYGGDVSLVATLDGEESLTAASSVELELVGSALPPGLELSADGQLTGTPTTPGLYEFHVRVEDALHRYHIRLVSLLVKPGSLNPVATSPATPSLAGSLVVR